MVMPSADATEQSYSVVQTKRFLEGQPFILIYDTTLPRFTPPAIILHNILMLDASYYTLDVTAIVARIAITQNVSPLVVRATNAQFGMDPAPYTGKQLSITYAYRSSDGSFDHHIQVVGQDDTIAMPFQNQIHAELTIHAAYWADLDVTQMLRSLVSCDQTLQI